MRSATIAMRSASGRLANAVKESPVQRRQRVLERDCAGEHAAVEFGKDDVHREIGSAEAASALAPCGAARRRADDLQDRDIGASSGVNSPLSPLAAKAVVVTMSAGSSRANAPRKNAAASPSLRLVTTSGAGAKPRVVSAVHSASMGAVSLASNSAR